MENDEEADQFRQIELHANIEKAAGLVRSYRSGIDFYRDKIDRYYK